MMDADTLDLYGVLTEPATLTMRRLLPAPAERVWAWLTDESLRRKWLAAGVMETKVGSSIEFVWRNDELSSPPGIRPEGFSAESRAKCLITECDPPRRLGFDWPGVGHVEYELAGQGARTLLTVVHTRVPDRRTLVGVSAGWHAHLDVLADRIAGVEPKPFWDQMARLRKDYEQRTPA